MARVLSLLVLSLLSALALATGAGQGERPVVVAVRVEGQALTPVTARIVERALARAEELRAECLVIVLDTPGGLLDSTRGLVKALLAARVPVVVYVPPGGRAASAGTFVALAAHVVAMGPGSNIGAAHPVQVGGLPIAPPEDPREPAPDEPGQPAGRAQDDKIVEDTTAWARALAAHRGRDPAWAAATVAESRSFSVEEARDAGIVDVMANDVEELLLLLDGRPVRLRHRTVHPRTADAALEPLEPWWGERVLAAISTPNVAFLLLLFGVYGVLFELYSPGWGVPGTLGAVCLMLGFFALAVLPIDYVGLLLVALAVVLFAAEAFVPSFGALTLGGVVCMTLGGLMLVDTPQGFLRLSLAVVLPASLATAAIVAFLVGGVVRAHGRPPVTGAEALEREVGSAAEDFVSIGGEFVGHVRLHGELWRARSPTPVRRGDALAVRDRDGLVVDVGEPATGGSETTHARERASS